MMYLFMEADRFNVVKNIEEMGLDGVGVRGLAKDLQQGRVGDEEETREQQPFLLQVSERKNSFLNDVN